MSQKIEITNWLGGISFSDRLGTEGSYYVGRAVNPLNKRNLGYLQAGGGLTSITSSVSGVNAMEIDEGHNVAYLIEKFINSYPAKLHKLNFDTGTISSGGAGWWPHSISNTAHAAHGNVYGEDAKIYSIGDTTRVFYSWNDNQDGDVGTVETYGVPTFDDDFMSKEPVGATSPFLSKNYLHPMFVWGGSGMMYIADGRYLHQFDGQSGGANGTLTYQRFSLPKYWAITSLFDAGDYIGITAHYYPLYDTVFSWNTTSRGRTAVFFWDGVSPSFNKKFPVEDINIRGSRSIDGNYYIFGENQENEGTIRRFNGSGFELISKIKINIASTESRTTRYPNSYGSISSYDNGIIIPSSQGNEIIYFGNAGLGTENKLFNIANINHTATIDMQCFSAMSYPNNIVISSRRLSNSKFYLDRISTTNNGNSDFQFKSLYYEFPQTARLNYVRAYFKTLATGQGDDISVRTDYNNLEHLGNISYAEDGTIETKMLSAKNILCKSVRLEVDKDEGAGIKYGKFVIDYDLID